MSDIINNDVKFSITVISKQIKSLHLCLFVIFLDEGPGVLASVTTLKSRLSNVIEPDFGLLDQLLSLDTLTRRQYEDIRYDRRARYRRSEALLELQKTSATSF